MNYRISSAFLLISLFAGLSVLANDGIHHKVQIKWQHHPTVQKPILYFEDAVYSRHSGELPVYHYRFPLKGSAKIKAKLGHEVFVDEDYGDFDHLKSVIPSSIQLITSVEKARNQYFGIVSFIPLVKSANGYKKLTHGDLIIEILPETVVSIRGGGPAERSVLADGTWYKIRVDREGVHKIDRGFLASLGIDVDALNPAHIKMYGAGGGSLPQSNSIPRQDDLAEIPILITGSGDGSLDASDQIYFFAEGPHKRYYDEENSRYRYRHNIYDDFNYYFISITTSEREMLSSRANYSGTAVNSTGFDDFIRLEEDKYNLLGRSNSHEGSGQLWVGEEFTNVRQRVYPDFEFRNIQLDEKLKFEVSFLGRSSESTEIEVSLEGETFAGFISRVNVGDVESAYARRRIIIDSISPSSDVVTVTLRYVQTPQVSNGWLDYIDLHARRDYVYSGQPLLLRDARTLAQAYSSISVQAPADVILWDVTNALHPVEQVFDYRSGKVEFAFESDEQLRKFLLFKPEDVVNIPLSGEAIDNQNLHSISDVDMLVVYHEDFREAANAISEHRRSFNDFNVAAVDIKEVYNEFSSGKKDPTALRDFVKMVYDRNPKFQYLLLVGTGSYDQRGRNETIPNHGFLPIYETIESLSPIFAFPSDDYFALLDDTEGEDLHGGLDISLGRIPASSPEEATLFINRIIDYEINPDRMKDWRNRVIFSADDEDGGLHFDQIENLANMVDDSFSFVNADKIYLDAYEQVSTPGGTRYPEVTQAIRESLFKGAIAFTYLGHGGPTGLAQERVLQVPHIEEWNNKEKTPILVTATCSFAPYDDPGISSAGEATIYNVNGGVAALLSTVRAVYAQSNFRLTKSVFERLLVRKNGTRPKIGDVITDAKNTTSGSSLENARKFSLFGDPAMEVALPMYNVRTLTINGKPAETLVDTLGALEKVVITGDIADEGGNRIADFNGKVYLTVYDKKLSLKTKGNDAGSQQEEFEIQKNTLFKGAASVTSGTFELSFNIPKDINYTFGEGKLSYYATDEKDRDATGAYSRIVVGGTDGNGIVDDEGPKVEVFMNDENFVFGGITNSDPILFIKLSDDFGINVTGNSIGHDLTAELDNDAQQKWVLNDHYEATLNDHTSGTVRFPLSDLEPGKHSIVVTAWDISNNVSQGHTEFYVLDEDDFSLRHILNYPNPFTTSTTFQFEHNLPDYSMDVMIQIFTVSGKLVKTIEETIVPTGFVTSDIHWDGKDDFGNVLAKGVYIYKIKVRSVLGTSNDRKAESDFEKLVILR